MRYVNSLAIGAVSRDSLLNTLFFGTVKELSI